jgi:hypothetical protein
MAAAHATLVHGELDERYRAETRERSGLAQDTRLADFFHSGKWEALLSTHGRHH